MLTILHFSIAAMLVSSTAVDAFTIANVAVRRVPFVRTTLHSNKGDSEDVTFVKSVLEKEIAYDEKTGRFFETNFGQGDCIPEEEYCFLDRTTGERIRLTVEEKERIFLDALQVCRESSYALCFELYMYDVECLHWFSFTNLSLLFAVVLQLGEKIAGRCRIRFA
jgi:hypothetical protein